MNPRPAECLVSTERATVRNVDTEISGPASVWKVVVGSMLLLAAPACAQLRDQISSEARIVGGIPIAVSTPALPTSGETTVAKSLQFPNSALPLATREEKIIGQQALSWLQSNSRMTAPSSWPPLRLDYLNVVAGVAGIPDTAYVRFIQTSNGLDVVGSQVVVAVSLRPTGNRIESVEAMLFPEIRTAANPGTMTAERASMQVALRIGSDLSRSTIQPLGERVRWLLGQWRVVQEFAVRGVDVYVTVDEATGQTQAWEARHHETYSGTVAGRLVLFNPQSTTTLDTVPLQQLYITDGGTSSTYTSASGNFTLSTASTANLPISLTGSWGSVYDQNLTPLGVTIVAGTPSPLNLLFNPTGNVDTNIAQTNAYFHENLIHDWIVSIGVDPGGIDTILPIYVNWPGNCNSFYIFSSINFYQAGNGCINTAYDTFIYHEYGHFVDDVIGGITNEALSEGWGDIMATYGSGQPLVGEGLYAGQPNSFVRNASNTYQYNPNDEAHLQGQAWMGFAWDLRQSLIAALGQSAGAVLAENLVLPVYFNNSPDIPSAVRAVAVRDGLSGQVGGPHYGLILAAAINHGLAFALNITSPAITITSPSSGATISGVVTVKGTATDEGVVTNVSLEFDGMRIGTASGTTAWTFSLDTAIIPAGPHTLTAVATDEQGYQGTRSIPVTVASSQESPFVTAISAGNLAGTLPTWAGMEIQVGASPVTVTALGRIYVAGNNQTHALKLVDAATGIDLPNAAVNVTMVQSPFSSFVYGELPAPVTLNAGQIYYVLSQEQPGGDVLYDSTTRVQTTGVASVVGPVSYRRGWSAAPSPNQTYGPVDFLYQTQAVSSLPVITSPATATAVVGMSFNYTITATHNPSSFNATGLPIGWTVNKMTGTISGVPQTEGIVEITLTAANSVGSATLVLTLTVNASPPPGKPTAFVTSISVSTLAETLPPWVGMELQVGASPLTVTALGRIYLPGNNQTHTLKLVDAVTGTDVPGSSATVTMAPPTASSFVYGNTATPVTLSPGNVYYVVSQEFPGGDSLYDSTTTVGTTAVATVLGPASYRRGWTAPSAPNQIYGPVDFIYEVASNPVP